MDFFKKPTVAVVLVVAATGAAGWLIGYLTGASSSPVVAAVIPLILGVVSVFGIGRIGDFLSRQAMVSDLTESLPKFSAEEQEVAKKVIHKLDAASIQAPPICLGSVLTIVFIVAVYKGVHDGSNERRTTSATSKSIGYYLSKLSPVPSSDSQDSASVDQRCFAANAYFRAKALRLKPEEIDCVMALVQEVISSPSKTDDHDNTSERVYRILDKVADGPGAIEEAPLLLGGR